MPCGSFPLKTSDSRSSASLCFVTSEDHRRVFDDLFGVLLIDPFARSRSLGDAHARGVNKIFRMMIDLPAAAPSIFMDVKSASLNGGNRRRWQVDFVFHRLTMIGKLEFGIVHAVELPNHSDKISLPPKQFANNETCALAHRRPAQMFVREHALRFDQLFVKLGQRQLGW